MVKMLTFCTRGFKLGDPKSGEKENQLYRIPPEPTQTKTYQLFRTPQYVVCTYEAFDIVSQLHIELGHIGKNRLREEFDRRYHGVTRDEV